LKAGLKSKDPEVRYNAAVALAYLGDATGLDELADAARNQYAFRIFALAAMASLEDPEVHVKLRELMDVDSSETRYGAFRALTTLDANDPFVHGRKINDQFSLHVLATGGPPLVHLTNCKKTEVVVFGADQELRTPLFARAGTCILVSAPAGSAKVRVSRFAVGQEDQRKVVSTRVEDVILAISELGATFPDVAQFLTEANAQRNLAGRLEIDALPRAGRFYERDRLADGADSASHGKKRVGSSNAGPNLFSIEIEKPASKDGPDEGARASSADDKPETGRKKSRHGTTDDDFALTVKGSKASTTDESTAVAATDTKPSDDSSSAAKISSAKPASPDKTPDGKSADGKAPAATNVDPIDQPDTPSSPPSRFSFWRLFSFGTDGVSGNKEP
jgi:hypothetical protein